MNELYSQAPPSSGRGLCRIVGRIRLFREAGGISVCKGGCSHPDRHHSRSFLTHSNREWASGTCEAGVHLGSLPKGRGWVMPQHQGSSSTAPAVTAERFWPATSDVWENKLHGN